MGDEDFVEAMQKRRKALATSDRRHFLQRIVKSVSAMTGVEEPEMRRRQHGGAVNGSRESLCYVARHHGQVSMRELARYLQIKESSTPSPAVRRAEERMKAEAGFDDCWIRSCRERIDSSN